MKFNNFLDSRTGSITQLGLAAYVVVMFFCNLAVYLSLAVSPRLQPQYWLGLLIILLMPLALLSVSKQLDVLRMPLLWWCALFIAVTLLSFVFIPESHVQQLKERTRDVLLLLALTSAFSSLREYILIIRKLVLVATLLGILINLISIVHNRFLLPAEIKYAARPAGLYINPNESATALLLGMMLSISILSRKWRVLYLAVVLVGVLATFSREAIIGWFILTALFVALGFVDWKRIVLWVGVVAVPSVLILVGLIKFKLINVHVAWYYGLQLNRLTWFMRENGHHNSVTIRVKLIKESWDLFLKHPWIGNGIGSTEHWALPYSTHNMYLYYMADYGVAGALLFPLLVLAVTIQARGETRKIGYCFAAFMLFWGWFDHDIVRNYYSLFAFALMAVLAWLSRQQQVADAEKSNAKSMSVAGADSARH